LSFINSEEFKSRVYDPFIQARQLEHTSLGEKPDPFLLQWAARSLPLSMALREELLETNTLAEAYARILLDPDFSLIAGLHERFGRSDFTSALKYIAGGPDDRRVIGFTEDLTSAIAKGWVMDVQNRDRTMRVEVLIDGQFHGTAEAAIYRPDVQEIHGGKGFAGFTYRFRDIADHLTLKPVMVEVRETETKQSLGYGQVMFGQQRSLDQLERVNAELAQIKDLLTRIEGQLPDIRGRLSFSLDSYTQYFKQYYGATSWRREQLRAACDDFQYKPLISIVMPTYRSDLRLLEKALASIGGQYYTNWELVVTDDHSSNASAIAERISTFAKGRPQKINLLLSEAGGGISENTNRGLAKASGDYIAFMDHDDTLELDALLWVVAELQGEDRPEFLYSDEDRISEDEQLQDYPHSPFFKSDFDYDLLLQQNYMAHLVVVSAGLLRSTSGLRSEYDGAQDHDFVLRAVSSLPQSKIRHIPRILYHWRHHAFSMSTTADNIAPIEDKILKVVATHLETRKSKCAVERHANALGLPRPFTARVKWEAPLDQTRAAVIVPTRDRLDLLQPCISSLIGSRRANRTDFEILIVDNESSDTDTIAYMKSVESDGVRVISSPGDFNWSGINNFAASQTDADVLIFLNNDTMVLSEDWCDELCRHALRPDVGAVGARLLYEDGTIQHAGTLLGVGGIAGHEGVGELASSGGYFDRNALVRRVSAVTGACLATRADVFRSVGAFDAVNLAVAYNDVDYCLRLGAAGYAVIYNPYCIFYHFESKSRGFDVAPEKAERARRERVWFENRWKGRLSADPFYNAHFELSVRPFSQLKAPPELEL
jgi:GT2 family glycosyltransferase